MPYSFTYEPATDAYVDIRLWGILTQEEFDTAAASMLPALREWSRVLFDAADLENAGEAFAMFLKSTWRGDLPTGLRQAAVVGPTAAAVARAWMRVAGPGSAGTQAFRERGPAVEWLLAEYQTTTGGS